MSSSNTPLSVPEAPAPWRCHGQAFWFFTYTSPSSSPAQLPPAYFSPPEESSEFSSAEASGNFKGGLATMMIVRYTETPVGPYDELLLIPGAFRVPVSPKKLEKMRITRIYVSTTASVFNGRRNWNIPKTLAEFGFTPSAGGVLPYERVEVKLPGSTKPFFSVTLTSSSFLSKPIIPYSTKFSPLDMQLVIPPLPQSPNLEVDGMVGTKKWVATTPVMKGKIGLFWCAGGIDGAHGGGRGKAEKVAGDGESWPRMEGLWKFGIWWDRLELEFPLGVEVGEEEERKGR